MSQDLRDYPAPYQIGTLKAERDRLGSYNSHLIADREILFAENTRLRAALEQIRKAVLNDSRKSYIDDVARRAALEGK